MMTDARYEQATAPEKDRTGRVASNAKARRAGTPSAGVEGPGKWHPFGKNSGTVPGFFIPLVTPHVTQQDTQQDTRPILEVR